MSLLLLFAGAAGAPVVLPDPGGGGFGRQKAYEPRYAPRYQSRYEARYKPTLRVKKKG